MNVLLTNLQLSPFRGTENWCYSVGSELIRQGHNVSIFSPSPRSGVPFYEQAGISYVTHGTFDLILDNHSVTCPGFNGKIIHTCHGTIPAERPMKNVYSEHSFHSVNVAVSDLVANYWNINKIIPNGIDCGRFKCIKPVNDKIKTVLSLCSSDKADLILSNICKKFGYRLITTFHNEVFDVERLINESDIVVGVGRSLLDAMACCRPVISFDCRFYVGHPHGLGYIKGNPVLDDNLVGRNITMTEQDLMNEFLKYDPLDGIKNRYFVLNNRNIIDTVKQYLEVYNEID